MVHRQRPLTGMADERMSGSVNNRRERMGLGMSLVAPASQGPSRHGDHVSSTRAPMSNGGSRGGTAGPSGSCRTPPSYSYDHPAGGSYPSSDFYRRPYLSSAQQQQSQQQQPQGLSPHGLPRRPHNYQQHQQQQLQQLSPPEYSCRSPQQSQQRQQPHRGYNQRHGHHRPMASHQQHQQQSQSQSQMLMPYRGAVAVASTSSNGNAAAAASSVAVTRSLSQHHLPPRGRQQMSAQSRPAGRLSQSQQTQQQQQAASLPAYTVATVRLYNLLHSRTRHRAFIMPKNLGYAAKPTMPQVADPSRCYEVVVNALKIRVSRTRDTPSKLSVIVAACEAVPGNKGYCLYSAKIMELTTDSVDAGGAVSLPTPSMFGEGVGGSKHGAAIHSGSRGPKGLLLVLWDEHVDLSALKKRAGSSLSTGVRVTPSGSEMLLGLVPNESRCRWAFVPIAQAETRTVAVLNRGYIYCDPTELQKRPQKNACVKLSWAGSGGNWPLNNLNSLTVPLLITHSHQPIVRGPRPKPRGRPALGSAGSVALQLPLRGSNGGLGGLHQHQQQDEDGEESPVRSSSGKINPTIFHYLSRDTRTTDLTHSELTEHWSCPLCTLRCSTFMGLGLHLRASHDLFDYTFESKGHRVIPEVWVKCWPYPVRSAEFTTSLKFPVSGAVLYHDTASKEFIYFRGGALGSTLRLPWMQTPGVSKGPRKRKLLQGGQSPKGVSPPFKAQRSSSTSLQQGVGPSQLPRALQQGPAGRRPTAMPQGGAVERLHWQPQTHRRTQTPATAAALRMGPSGRQMLRRPLDAPPAQWSNRAASEEVIVISDDSDEGEVESGGGNEVAVLHSDSEADEANRLGRIAAEAAAAALTQKGGRSRKGKAAVASAALSAAAAAFSAAVPPEAAERASTRRIAERQPREGQAAVSAEHSEQPASREEQSKVPPEALPQVPLQPPKGPEPQVVEELEEANGGDDQDEDMLEGAEEELRVKPSSTSLPTEEDTEAPVGAAPTPAAPAPAPLPPPEAPEDKPDSPALRPPASRLPSNSPPPSNSAAPVKAKQPPPPADNQPKEPNSNQQSPPQPPAPAAAVTPVPPKSLHSRQNGDLEPRPRTHLQGSALTIFRQPRPSQSNTAAFGSPSQVKKLMSTRTYFHSKSCQVMKVDKVLKDRDSDDECDLEEYEQINRHSLNMCSANPTDSEREFMLLWNLYVLREPIYSDAATAAACLRFATANAVQLAEAKVRQKFVLHLVALNKFDLIKAKDISQCLSAVDAGAAAAATSSKGNREGNAAAKEVWLHRRITRSSQHQAEAALAEKGGN